MIRRPKPGESDLDEMMKEFEKNPAQTSSVLVNKRKPDSGPEPETKKPKSVFARQRESRSKPEPAPEIVNLSVLSEITERTCSRLPVPPCPSGSTGFPEILKLDKISGSGETKRSLFSQQFMKMKQSFSDSTLSSQSFTREPVNTPLSLAESIGGRSFILEGSGLQSSTEAEELHTENFKRLEAMSEQEILEEQEKLVQSLDPSLLEFLRTRRSMVPLGDKSVPGDEPMHQDLLKTQSKPNSDSKHEPEPNTVEDISDLMNKYPNMNRDEPEKREWMSSIPEVELSGDGKGGFSARFGFDGSLIDPNSAQVDVRTGLHHHGEEPERAGYTLSELFTLIRSSSSRQRVLALDILAAILDKYWTGVLDSCFSLNPVEEMVGAGLVSLLRSCLDEKEESVVFSATQCLANLLYSQGEESALDWTNLYSPEQPVLAPVLEEKDQEEIEELKDHELVQLDLILGLLRMDILPRLRYILTVLRPGPGVVLSSVKILVRISRHSLYSAQQVSHCPGLLQTLIAEFLPPLLPHTFSNTTLYGAPVWLVCKLCRVLSAWDLNLARFITQEFQLEPSLMVYLTIDPSQATIPSRESVLLCVESYRTWCTLLRYNLTTGSYTNLYPVLVRQLLYFIEKIDISAGTEQQFNYDVGCWLLMVLTTVLGCVDKNTLDWVHVADLRNPVETCTRKWLVQLSRQSELISTSACNLVGTGLTFLSVFYLKLKTRTEFNQDKFKEELFSDFTSIIQACFKSDFIKVLCEKMPVYSGYLSGFKEQKRSLPCLQIPGAVLLNGDVHPVLNPTSPIFILSSLFRFISVVNSIVPGVCPTQNILTGFKGYFQSLTVKPVSLVPNWFSRFESRLLFWALSTQFNSEVENDTHKLSVKVCGLLQRPDEILLRELMENIVFNQQILQSEYLLSSCLEALSVGSVSTLSCPTNLPEQDVNQILNSSLNNLDNIKATYMEKLFNDNLCRISLSYHNLSNQDNLSLVLRGEPVLSQDWPFYPLLQVYNWEQNGKNNTQVRIEDMRNCLAWLLLTDSNQCSPRENTARFYRLATIFLSGNDLFLDPVVHNLLTALLRGVMKDGLPDLSLSVPGLTSGHEFYLQLLDQYQAVSYGDQLFSLFISVPLSMSQPVAFRRTFWTEKPDLVRTISLKSNHLTKNIVEKFLEPQELETDILIALFHALRDNRIMKSRNEFLYSIASTQIKNLIRLKTENDELHKLIKYIKSTNKDEELRRDLDI